MAEKTTHEITLSGYKASSKEASLQFGVRGSSGMEQLHLTLSGAWAGMTVTATFLNGDGQSEPQLVDSDGYVAVPAIATAQADPKSRIVFYGTDGASSAYTADLVYRVSDRSDTNIEDAGKNPEESAFTQFVQQVNGSREAAQGAAQNAQAAAASAQENADKIAAVEILKPGSDFEVQPDGSFQIYKALALESVSVSPAVLEQGSEAESVTVKWAANKEPAALLVNGQEQTPAKSGSAVLAGNVTADTLFTVLARDARMEVSNGAWVRFKKKVFYGAAGESLQDPAILPGAALADSAARTITVNAAAGAYIWFCQPAEWKEPSFSVGGFEGGFTRQGTADYIRPDGQAVPYAMWRSEQSGLGSTSVVIR